VKRTSNRFAFTCHVHLSQAVGFQPEIQLC
jgi:hypothetical protein